MEISEVSNWLTKHNDAINSFGVIAGIFFAIITAIWTIYTFWKSGSRLSFDDVMKLAEKLAAEKGEKDAQVIKSLQETIQVLTKQDADQYNIQKALDLLAQGDTEEAEKIFEGIATEKKRKGKEEFIEAAEALRYLGSLAFLHDTQKAFSAYQRSVGLDPNSLDGWNQLGRLYRRIGEPENAENAYMTVQKFLLVLIKPGKQLPTATSGSCTKPAASSTRLSNYGKNLLPYIPNLVQSQ